MHKLAYLFITLLIMQLAGLALLYQQHRDLVALKHAYRDLDEAFKTQQSNGGVTDVNQEYTTSAKVEQVSSLDSKLLEPASEAVINSVEERGREQQELKDKITDRLAIYGFSAFDSEQIADLELAAIATYSKIKASGVSTAMQEMHLLMQETMEKMREELGDFGYQAYLEAKSLPTAVKISGVSQRGNGGVAGLRIGDEIERYDGARVYTIFELNRRVQENANDRFAELRTVHYRRDGAVYTAELPPGMMGISAMPIRPRQFFESF